MNSMLTLIFFSLTLSAKIPDSVSEKIIEQNGLVFTEKMTVHYPLHFDKMAYKSIVEKIGYIFQPHARIDHLKMLGDQLIYKAAYTIGDYGMRVIPGSLCNDSSSRHLIAGGDSNVFSEGVPDAETFTAGLAHHLKDYHVYNFGHRGGGPHNTLAMMENYPFYKLIKEPEGIFLYNFFTGHMFERVIGSKNYVAWDTGKSPYYDLDRGVLVHRGQFNDRTLITPLYKYIATHSWLNQLLPILPQIRESHVELIAHVLKKMKFEYLKQFPKGRYIVIINNSYNFSESNETKWLYEKLKKHSIEYVVIDYMPELQQGMIFQDMHLNGRGQKMQSQVISEKLLKILSLH